MSDYIEPVERLADMFRRLDGVGKKTALRLAFSVVNMPTADAEEFAAAILAAKHGVTYCRECQNISTDELCPICSCEERDHTTVCVVEDTRAVAAIERTKEYFGLYHVLHGTISPIRGITPDKLKIRELLTRLSEHPITEVIIATNPTTEGEATAMYISRLISPLGIKVSRIANGIPVGGDLEFVDNMTLSRAIAGRYELT